MTTLIQTKIIDGLSVTCSPLEPVNAYNLLPELAPVLGLLQDARGAFARSAEGDASGLTSALLAASKLLGGGKIVDLMVALMAQTVIVTPQGVKHVVRDRGTFNLTFSTRTWSAIPVAAFALEVGFGNFIDVVSRHLGEQAPAAAASS